MKTKVWFVVWGLKDGGAEVLARVYASMVDQTAFDPTLVVMYPFENTANYRQAMDAGIKILSVYKKRNTFTRVMRMLFGKWYVSATLRKMLAEEEPAAIHFNSQMADCFTSLGNALSGVRLLYTCHSEPKKYFSEKEELAVRKLIQDNNLRLIALHDDMKVELDQLFAKNDTVVIRNGVDFSRFHKEGWDADAMRTQLGIPQDAYVVGHIGRFNKTKNHIFLLKVFRAVLDRKPNAHLLLVGSGDLKEQITLAVKEQHLENCVTVLSHRTDVPELLHAMDVMVFPSIFEGLSVTLVEAQVSGLRCVISDTINSANLLTENTIPMSLDAPVEEWAEVVLNSEIKNDNYGNIKNYDMNQEIHRLERLYQGELDV